MATMSSEHRLDGVEQAPDLNLHDSEALSSKKVAPSVSYVGILLCGLLLIVALHETDGGLEQPDDVHEEYVYSMTLTIVSMFIALVGFLRQRKNLEEGEVINLYISYFLFALTFVAACLMTFKGPFLVTSNGYFGAWGLAFFAAGVVSDARKQEVSSVSSEVSLFACSIVTIFSVASLGLGMKDLSWDVTLALVVAVLTIPVLLILRTTLGVGFRAVVLLVFSILWIIAASVVTFDGPFFVTGNGYFGAWGGAFACVLAAHEAWTAT